MDANDDFGLRSGNANTVAGAEVSANSDERAVTIPAQGRRVEYVYWADASATTLKSMEPTETPAPGAPK